MVITKSLRSARLELFLRNRDRKKWIGISRTRHGQWAEARKATNPNPKTVAAKFSAWKDAIAELHTLDERISGLNAYLNKGATTCSLSLAKGVAVWEGGQSSDGLFHPYWDQWGSVWTIGYGHTSSEGGLLVTSHTKPLTRAEATVLLLHDLAHLTAPSVLSAFKSHNWKPNQKMFDSLVSFAFNLGPGYFSAGHSLGDAMRTKNAHLVAHSLLLYDVSGGVVLEGLVRRRQWEKQLFLGGTYSVNN